MEFQEKVTSMIAKEVPHFVDSLRQANADVEHLFSMAMFKGASIVTAINLEESSKEAMKAKQEAESV